MLQLRDHRVQRACLVIRRALVRNSEMALGREALAQFPHDPGLADTGLAREQDYLAFAIPGLLPTAQQQRDLLLSPHQRREARCLSRLEAPLGAAFARHPPDRERVGEPLEALRAEISQLEQATHEPPCRLADDNALRRGERLQPRREVRRLTDHRLVPYRALSDEVAHHHLPRGDAHARLQPDFLLRRQPSHCLDQLEARAHGSLGVVLMRAGPAEIGQDAVPQTPGGMALEALDHRSSRAVVGAHDRAHVLGIEPGGQSGRADQVAEQDGQLPPLGPSSRRGLWQFSPSRRRFSRCLIIGQRSDRPQQQPSVAERNTELLEILIRQLRQDVGRDVVVPERRLVTLQPQLPQPSRDVHLGVPACRVPPVA